MCFISSSRTSLRVEASNSIRILPPREMIDSNSRLNQIFISYRREDNADVTGRIYDRLVHKFGKASIFKDIDSIPLGVNVREHINAIVQECDVVLVMIGERWSGETKKTGKRRIDSPEDFVRIEIESALQRNIPVIPLLIHTAQMPTEASLPESLKGLAIRNGMPIGRDPHFHSDMDRLIKALEAYFDNPRSEEQKGNAVAGDLETISSPPPQAHDQPTRETPLTFEGTIKEAEKPNPPGENRTDKLAGFSTSTVPKTRISWISMLGYVLAVGMGIGIFAYIYSHKENARLVVSPAQLVTQADLRNALRDAKSTIRATGFLVQAIDPDLVSEKTARIPNFNVELLMVDPLNSNVVCARQRDEDNYLTYGKILLKVRIFHKNCKSLLGNKLHLGLTEAYPTMVVIMIDDDLYAYFYPYNKSGTDSPILKFTNYANDERARFFVDHYNKLRAGAKELTQDADFKIYEDADLNFKCPAPVSH